jgi:RNA polymerase sigma factor for flagellar operon FliA
MECAIPVAAPSDLAALWRRWGEQRDLAERDALVHAYTPYARMLAAKCFSSRVCQELEFKDYLQYAMVGLLEAIDRFEPGREAKFETFAGTRIEGAVRDGVENLSEIHKQLAVRRRMVRDRLASMTEPADAEPTERTEASALERLAGIAVGLAIGFALEDSGMFDSGERPSQETAYSRLEMRQVREQLTQLVQLLPERERLIVHRHYFQHVPFDHIAASLNLTKGRVSQIHKSALNRLRQLRQDHASFRTSL